MKKIAICDVSPVVRQSHMPNFSVKQLIHDHLHGPKNLGFGPPNPVLGLATGLVPLSFSFKDSQSCQSHQGETMQPKIGFWGGRNPWYLGFDIKIAGSCKCHPTNFLGKE